MANSNIQPTPTFASTFINQPVLGWAIDDFEQLYEIFKNLSSSSDYLKNKLDGYTDSFNSISMLFDSAPINLNLGGATEKSKLVPTDKSIGVFDFSLASRGLYRVPEYYSEKLAQEKPDRFVEFELPSGVIPPNFVKYDVLLGNKIFYYEEDGVKYNCVIRQKGDTEIELGVKGAKKKFATRTRKVYLTYKRNKGKVKYVEIYSLFYYTNLSGDVQYAIRHIPAVMVAEHLESMGVKVRFYMTRFVQLDKRLTLRQKYDVTELPLYKDAPNKQNPRNLFIQPIISKEYGQEFDKKLGFLISSSSNSNSVYRKIAQNSLKKEVTNNDPDPFGRPSWSQNDYFEGIERYRNKYEQYVKLGLFKAKEVTPEAMLFFHDMMIKENLMSFIERGIEYFNGKYTRWDDDSQAQYLIDINVNPFFNWWMRISAHNLKNKIDLINSNELKKDLILMHKDFENNIDEFYKIVDEIPDTIIANSGSKIGELYKLFIKDLGIRILRGYEMINSRDEKTFRPYVTNIANEISTYALGLFFPTPDERQQYRDSLIESILIELQNF